MMPFTMTPGISMERQVLLAVVGRAGGYCAQAPFTQLLSTPQPGMCKGWLVSSEGSEDGMLLTPRSAPGWPASHSNGELLGCGDSKLLP